MSATKEVITLDDTDSNSVSIDVDSLNNSKRKADETESDCELLEAIHPSKRLCQDDNEHDAPLDSQIITVVFQTEDAARRYSKDITDFIAQLTKSEIATSVVKDGKPCLEFYAGMEVLENTNGSQSADNHQVSSSEALPQYEQSFSGVIGVQGKEKAGDDTKPKNVCFNCEGDHMIALCPEPRDAARIAKNRSAHSTRNPVYNRYHEETEQKFGHLEPGRISDGLREALGLRADALPLHTYRMRALGYPPGWLRAARLQRSNIAVHHAPVTNESGKESGKPSEEEEHYDLSKLISFPGFNVECPYGCKDEHRRNGFPPMERFWSLRVMRQRLKRAPARRADARRQPADLPSSALANGKGSESEPAAEATDNGEKREGSPSLETLEDRRRALLESLDTPAAGQEDGELGEEDMDEDMEEDEDGEDVTAPVPDSELLVHAPPAASSTPQAPVLTPGASRRRELGTPVAAGRAHVVYDAQKWSAGITEHIPYENLPGATGAWERMSSLVKKVRDHISGKN